MFPRFTPSVYFLSLLFPVLASCVSVAPHIEDWDRERISEIPETNPTVSVCFDMKQHSRELVYQLAKDECQTRIREIQNLVQHQNVTSSIANATQAEGKAFEGPVQREKRLQAMLTSLQLNYVDNDKWECPLLTPNRITFECKYNPQAQDSSKRQQLSPEKNLSPDLPPELPDDLKPQ